MYDYEDTSSIPWSEYKQYITDLIIEDGVTSIGDNALYSYTKLTSVTIPETVTSIGYKTFYNCASLTSVTIPESVTTIGEEAFRYCSDLTNLTISKNVTIISNKAFANCIELTSVTIPESVTTIDEEAFYHCMGLKNITISKNVTSIGNKAFTECSALRNVFYAGTEDEWNLISIADNNDYLLNAAIYFNADETILEEYVQDNITYTINTQNITAEVTKSSSSVNADVTIPANISVDGVTYEVTSIGEYAFYNRTNLTSITIPESITTIGDCAFRYCTSLNNVIFSDGLITIGGYAFWNCTSLTNIIIPESVTSIGDGAFWYCGNITSISLPSGLTYIGEYAFTWCSFTNITIPKSVTSIGYAAFAYCSSLTSVYYTGTEDEWNAITIGDCNEELLNASLHCNFGAQISGDYTLDSITYSGDTVTVAVSNTSDDAVTCQVYAGIYAADGTLKGVGMVDAVIDAGGGTVEIVPSAAISDGDTVKAFMWYGTAPLAVCNSI